MNGEIRLRGFGAFLFLTGFLVFFPVRGEALAGLSVSQSPMFHAASLQDVPLVPEERRSELLHEMRERFFSPWAQTEPRKAKEEPRKTGLLNFEKIR